MSELQDVAVRRSAFLASPRAGEPYFVPPGHTPELYAGNELVEFSPTAERERTLEVVMRNAAGDEAAR